MLTFHLCPRVLAGSMTLAHCSPEFLMYELIHGAVTKDAVAHPSSRLGRRPLYTFRASKKHIPNLRPEQSHRRPREETVRDA